MILACPVCKGSGRVYRTCPACEERKVEVCPCCGGAAFCTSNETVPQLPIEWRTYDARGLVPASSDLDATIVPSLWKR
jgi:hypothetical protein